MTATAEDKAMDLLSERLAAAEEDTQHLAEQLSLMASSSSLTVESPDTTSQTSPPPCVMSPFEAKGLKNTDALTSRLCKAESAVTTLKLAFTTLQNDEDRRRQLADAEVDIQISDIKKQHKEEMDKLRDEVVCLQQELHLEREAKSRSRSQIQNLQDALMEATQVRMDTSTKVEHLETEKQKLLQDVASLENQLLEEHKSQENLEVSHFSLLNRIEQMESIMDCEKNEVQGLTSMYDLLQQETDKSKAKLREEQKQRIKIEKSCQILLVEKNKLQDLYERSEASNQALLTEMDQQRERQSQFLAQLEQQQDLIKQQQSELKEQMEKSLLEQEIATLKTNLQSLQMQFDENTQESVTLKKEFESCQKELKLKEEEVIKYEQQVKEGVLVKEQIARIQKEKVLAINEKEKSEKQGQLLLQETNEQKSQLENECKRLTLELHTCETSRKGLQEDNTTLQERMVHLERQQAATEQVEEVMKEMLEQKKKLAYEKGNLQSQVQQLRTQVEELGQKNSDLKQLTQLNKTLQNKYIQLKAIDETKQWVHSYADASSQIIARSQKELKGSELKLKQLEKKLTKNQKETSLKDKNLQEMMESRDKAINESEALKEEIKNRRNKTQQKMLSLQKIAENGKMDNKKLAETLQAVIKSHGRLENSVEELQMELGRKDSEIDHLQKERSMCQSEMSDLQKELSSQQQKLMSIATAQTEELGQVRKSLLKSKEDNKKMTDSMEEVLNCNISLRESVNTLTAELEQKIKSLKEIKKLREKEQTKAMSEGKLLEGKLDSLREQLRKERGQNSKKTSKEVAEVKHQNDRLLALNGELSRSNSDLRNKILVLQRTNKECNEKVQDQKRKTQQLQQQLRESSDQMKVMRTDMEELQKSKQKFLETNNDQLLTIQRFQNQVSSLQLELSTLTVEQTNSNSYMKTKENILLQEKQIEDEHQFRKKLTAKKDGATIKNSSEEKLRKLVLQESDQISERLKEAKQWFVSKFDELHSELLSSKKMREDLEEDQSLQQSRLEEETFRAQEAAQRAQVMLKASRSSLTKLAEFADQADLDTRIHITQLQKAINEDRNPTKKMETK